MAESSLKFTTSYRDYNIEFDSGDKLFRVDSDGSPAWDRKSYESVSAAKKAVDALYKADLDIPVLAQGSQGFSRGDFIIGKITLKNTRFFTVVDAEGKEYKYTNSDYQNKSQFLTDTEHNRTTLAKLKVVSAMLDENRREQTTLVEALHYATVSK